MVPDDSNEFFGHLNQPATPRRTRRPSSNRMQKPSEDDFGSVPDPFGDEPVPPLEPPPGGAASVLSERGRARNRTPKGPGLSPGIPQVREETPTREIPRSGVVLTPSGVKRVDDTPPAPPPRKVVSQPVDIPEDDPEDFH